MDEQGAAGPVGARDAGHQAGAAGQALPDLGFEPDLGQLGGHVLGGDPFARARGLVAGVGGVDADQVAAQLHDFGAGVGRRRGHALFLPAGYDNGGGRPVTS